MSFTNSSACPQVSSRQLVHIHPSSCLFHHHPHPAYLMFSELIHTSKCYMRCVTIEPMGIENCLTFIPFLAGLCLLLILSGYLRLLLIILYNIHLHDFNANFYKMNNFTVMLTIKVPDDVIQLGLKQITIFMIILISTTLKSESCDDPDICICPAHCSLLIWSPVSY